MLLSPQVHCGVESHKNLLVHSHWHRSVGGGVGDYQSVCSHLQFACNFYISPTLCFVIQCHQWTNYFFLWGLNIFCCPLKKSLQTAKHKLFNSANWHNWRRTINMIEWQNYILCGRRGIQLICWILVQRAVCSEHWARGGGRAINTNGGKWGFMERERDPLSWA